MTIDPVGYTYKAKQLCPLCAVRALSVIGERGFAGGASYEYMIRFFARFHGIDYDDPTSYDSDDFPKPIFSDQLDCDTDEHERCNSCGDALCDTY